MKKIIFALAGLCLVMASCSEPKSPTKTPVDGMKVAYMVNMPQSEIFALCSEGFTTTADKLGMIPDTYYFTNLEELGMKASDLIEQGYKGLFLSHLQPEFAYVLVNTLEQLYPDAKLVTFDTEFRNLEGKIVTFPNVTQLFQNDEALSQQLLDYICTLKKDATPAKVLKIWDGPGKLAAFDRRDIAYTNYENSNKIETVATIGICQTAEDNFDEKILDAENIIYNQVKEYLAGYQEGAIDAIWCAFDVYAQGCYKALKELNLNIPMVSADISNQDIQAMTAVGSPWKASACTDFRANGEQGLRILALELNNQYQDIKVPFPVDEDLYIEMPPTLIEANILTPSTTVNNLKDVAPASYGDPANYVTCDWMKEAIGY